MKTALAQTLKLLHDNIPVDGAGGQDGSEAGITAQSAPSCAILTKLLCFNSEVTIGCFDILDNCCFNRPFDDQSQLQIWLETQAKLDIQQEALAGKYHLAWSYVLDYEISISPFEERKEKFMQWKNIAQCSCMETEEILLEAENLRNVKFKTVDALHIAAAKYMGCDYIITTDKKMLNKNVPNIKIVDPIAFLKLEAFHEN